MSVLNASTHHFAALNEKKGYVSSKVNKAQNLRFITVHYKSVGGPYCIAYQKAHSEKRRL